MQQASTSNVDSRGSAADSINANSFSTISNLFILLLGILVSLFLVELALRLIGFSFHLYPEKMEFGYPDFKTMETHYIEDPVLFWTQRDYKDKIERLIGSPPDVLHMGDSCTEFGRYNEFLEKLFHD